jgi:hypothetical protein
MHFTLFAIFSRQAAQPAKLYKILVAGLDFWGLCEKRLCIQEDFR